MIINIIHYECTGTGTCLYFQIVAGSVESAMLSYWGGALTLTSHAGWERGRAPDPVFREGALPV